MKSIKQQQLNIYEDFMTIFEKLTTKDVLIWIKSVMEVHFEEDYTNYNKQVLNIIEDSINGQKVMVEARTLAFEIHKVAKIQQNDKQFYLRALGHMVSTIHVKTHALKACDYIIKMIQFKTKNYDAVVSERLRQIALISKV